MMYQALAVYYDELVGDEETTLFWKNEIKKQINAGSILEYACGSGDMAIALAKDGYAVTAGDISEAMLQSARAKPGSELVHWQIQDMCAPAEVNEFYDGVICLCDSFNYLLEDEQVYAFFHNAYQALKPGGCFIFDTHSLDRLKEFEDEYLEEGSLHEVQYEWSILAQEDRLYQNFLFFDENGVTHHEQHIQRVFAPSFLKEQLEECGFSWKVMTDFKKPGIQPGEKYFYLAKKEK